MSDRDFEYAPCGNHSDAYRCPNCDVFALKIRIETLEAENKALKDWATDLWQTQCNYDNDEDLPAILTKEEL